MREGNNIINHIPLDQVDQEFNNIRAGYDPKNIEELAESIKRIGLLQPIIVRREDGRYQIICGHRRFLAVKYLKWMDVPAIEMAMDDQEVDLAKIHENVFREEINKIEEAKYYVFLMQKYGYTEKQIAGKINKTPGYICQHIEIINYCPELKKALEEKTVSFSVARELNKINGLMKRRSLIRAAIENGITARTAALWRREANMEINKEDIQDKVLDDEKVETAARALPTIKCHMCEGQVPVDKVKSLVLCPECRVAMEMVKDELMKQDKEPPPAAPAKPAGETGGEPQKK